MYWSSKVSVVVALSIRNFEGNETLELIFYFFETWSSSFHVTRYTLANKTEGNEWNFTLPKQISKLSHLLHTVFDTCWGDTKFLMSPSNVSFSLPGMKFVTLRLSIENSSRIVSSKSQFRQETFCSYEAMNLSSTFCSLVKILKRS